MMPSTCANSFSADFAGDARDFSGEGVELIDHRVDGVFEFKNFAFDVDRDFARQIAAGNGRCNFGNVANLSRQVTGHGIDGVGQIFPGAGDTDDDGLATEFSVGADLASDARNFRREGSQLVDHRVDGFFELEDFAANIDGDFAGQVAAGDSGGDFGDVADLAGEVAGHGVDRIGEIFPGAGDAGYDCLAAKFAVGADLAGDAGDLRGKNSELLNHRVDDAG